MKLDRFDRPAFLDDFNDEQRAKWSEMISARFPKSFWTYVRGTEEKPVRAVYEVPSELGFVVGDVTIDGRPIAFGTQIADFVRLTLNGIGTRFGQSTVAPMTGCLRPKALDDAAVLESFAVGSAPGLEWPTPASGRGSRLGAGLINTEAVAQGNPRAPGNISLRIVSRNASRNSLVTVLS